MSYSKPACPYCGSPSKHHNGCPLDVGQIKFKAFLVDDPPPPTKRISIDRRGVVSFLGGFDPEKTDDWDALPQTVEVVLARRVWAVEKLRELELLVLSKKLAALGEIASLPGPHFSSAAKTAIAIAKKALEG